MADQNGATIPTAQAAADPAADPKGKGKGKSVEQEEPMGDAPEVDDDDDDDADETGADVSNLQAPSELPIVGA